MTTKICHNVDFDGSNELLGCLECSGKCPRVFKDTIWNFLMLKIVFKKVFLGQFFQIKFLKGHKKRAFFALHLGHLNALFRLSKSNKT